MVNEFNNAGYVVVRNFVDETTIQTISRYMENKIVRGEWGPDYSEPVTRYSYYADPLIEVMLRNSTSEVEKMVGEELFPTYSYSRIYLEGEELEKHVDRPSCEVSVTINVAFTGENSPIYMKYPGRDANKYYLNPGDAVIYQGCVVEHWRDKLEKNQMNVQFMLHYVKKNGPNSGFALDRREKLGQNSNVRKK